MFNPKRLTLARKRQKLTAKKLAEKAGLTSVTLSRLETGLNKPEPSTITSLAKALGYPEDFFLGDDLDELTAEAVSFRSLTAMTAKERESAMAAGSFVYMLVDWISERFNLPELKFIDYSEERNPEAAARALREHWSLGESPIKNMVWLLESKGVRVFSLSENTQNVDAFSSWRNNTPYVFLNTFKTAERSRFDAAHELGHLVLHRHGGPQQGKKAEVEANRFAASFLMPKEDVCSRISRVSSIDQLILAKKRWRVSLPALTYRLHKLNIISQWQYHSFNVEINKRGLRKKEVEGIEREESVVLKKVFSELWGDKMTRESVAKELNLPFSEIESFVYGLMGPIEKPEALEEKRRDAPKLHVVQ